MSKNIRGGKEYSRLQEIQHENRKLKRENASLRKQLARIDLDRHSYVREIVEEHYVAKEREETTENMLKRMKEEWKCKKCEIGFLEIIVYSKVGNPWYFRRCSEFPKCQNRTKSQQYSPDKVEGPLKVVIK